MSTDFIDGRRFVYGQTIFISPEENTNETMSGVARSTGEIVTLSRDDIENGRAIFVASAVQDDIPDEWDLDDEATAIWAEGEGDAWIIPAEGSDPIGHRFSIDYLAKTVTYETADGRIALANDGFQVFLETAVRVDGNGHMICRFSQKLSDQEKLCQQAEATDHLADIELAYTALKQSSNGYDQAEAYVRDIMQRVEEDETYSVDAIFDKIDSGAEPLIARAMLDERTGSSWQPILTTNEFRHPQVRGIFKHFMAARLQDFPMDEVGITRFSNLDQAINALSEAFPDYRVVEPFDGGSVMPGYRTSDVHEFTDGKMTVITFSDLPGMPVHAYAYPNQLSMDADVTPDTTALTL